MTRFFWNIEWIMFWNIECWAKARNEDLGEEKGPCLRILITPQGNTKRQPITSFLHTISQRIQKPFYTVNTLLVLDYRKIHSSVWRASGWDKLPCQLIIEFPLKSPFPFFQVLQRQFHIKWRHLERSFTIWKKDSHLCGYCFYISLK